MTINKSLAKHSLIHLLAGSLLLLNSSFVVATENDSESTQHPKTCQEAIELVLSNIDDNSRDLLMSISKEELRGRRFITGWGKGIRDGFGLNEGNFELMKSCQELREDAAFHPVNISGIIMEEVWSALQQSK